MPLLLLSVFSFELTDLADWVSAFAAVAEALAAEALAAEVDAFCFTVVSVESKVMGGEDIRRSKWA